MPLEFCTVWSKSSIQAVCGTAISVVLKYSYRF